MEYLTCEQKLKAYPLWANLVVAAVLRDSLCVVSLLPCVVRLRGLS